LSLSEISPSIRRLIVTLPLPKPSPVTGLSPVDTGPSTQHLLLAHCRDTERQRQQHVTLPAGFHPCNPVTVWCGPHRHRLLPPYWPARKASVRPVAALHVAVLVFASQRSPVIPLKTDLLRHAAQTSTGTTGLYSGSPAASQLRARRSEPPTARQSEV
jgi:hypothetical protein